MPGSVNIAKIDFEFGQIDDVTFEYEAVDYLQRSPTPDEKKCLRDFFSNIKNERLGKNAHRYVRGNIWFLYVCNHTIEVLRKKPERVIVTKILSGGPSKGAKQVNP